MSSNSDICCFHIVSISSQHSVCKVQSDKGICSLTSIEGSRQISDKTMKSANHIIILQGITLPSLCKQSEKSEQVKRVI